MNYWAMEAAEGSPFSLMQDKALSDAVHRHGLSPTAARQAIEATGCEPVLLLFEPDSEAPAVPALSMLDCTFLSWMTVFSPVARNLCLHFGSPAEDFLSCGFVSQPGIRCFLHLPQPAQQIVDVDRSEFLLTIPAAPPIPFHMIKLVLSSVPPTGCFRAAVPGHQQVFAELIASPAFKDAWERRGLTGAAFRCLGTNNTHRLQAEAMPGI